MRDTVNFVIDTIYGAAKATAGFDRGQVIEEVSGGRWKVELDEGAQVICSVGGQCFDPTVGQRVDLARINGILTIEGPAA